MNLFSLLLKLIFRLYSKTIRYILMNSENRTPPRVHYTLYTLLLLALLNAITDTTVNYMAILSTTYYRQSHLYKPNTMVILFNAKDQLFMRKAFLCTSRNATHFFQDHAILRFAYDPVGICKWTAYIATCRVFQGFEELRVSHTRRKDEGVLLPYRTPYKPKKSVEVAACFSPLFYNERWQLILTTLEIYRHFGVHLQVFYIQSILQKIMAVLKIYESQEIAAIESWPSIKLDLLSLKEIGYDPNIELDWRNQASAHTDCLLKYREAAQFIIFGDVDDVLLPKLGGSYIEEFRMLSVSHPTAAGFTYSRYNTALKTGTRLEQFSLSQLIAGAQIADEWEDGKYVVNTSRVETAWLHYPGIRKRHTQMFTVPDNINMMVHLRNWTLLAKLGDTLMKPKMHKALTTHKILHKTQMRDLISKEALQAIQVNFDSLMHTTNYTTFMHLPVNSHYMPMIVNCYNTMFYSVGRKPTSCPGPLKCQLPSIPGLSCSVASTFFRRKPITWRTRLLIPENLGKFVTNLNGCSL